MDIEAQTKICTGAPAYAKCCGSFLMVAVLSFIITVCASCHEIGPQQQLLVKDPTGYYTHNGPWTGVVITHYEKLYREATLLKPEEYAYVKDDMTGNPFLVDGPQLLHLGPYQHVVSVQNKVVLLKDQYAVLKNEMTGEPRHEEGPLLLYPKLYDIVIEVKPKIVLQKDEYVKMVDRVTGAERAVTGPLTFVPEPLEYVANGTQKVVFLETEHAVLVLNRATGKQRLVTEQGVFVPSPYEDILEVRPLIHVLPHEAVIVRDAYGQLTYHMGSDGGGAAGAAFFLPPYHALLEMQWSQYSDASGDAHQTSTKVPVRKIDMRAQIMFFEYEVRTSDNVKLQLEGTIFWQVIDVPKLINATSDPVGDVWHHARSGLIWAVSNETLADFMSGFNAVVYRASRGQNGDPFYHERGVEVKGMEVTRYDCVDEKTAAVLQEIIQETTNRINRLTAQESDNEVRAAALAMDIQLELRRTLFITTKTENDRLEAQMQGEADGMKLMEGANVFIGGLNASVPSVDDRLELYKMHENLRSRNTDTENLASGSAHLFVTPQDLNLRIDNRGQASARALSEL